MLRLFREPYDLRIKFEKVKSSQFASKMKRVSLDITVITYVYLSDLETLSSLLGVMESNQQNNPEFSYK